MKADMGFPGGGNVDFQWPILDAADILLTALQVPGNRQAITKERGGYGCAENGLKVGNETAEFVQNGDDLGRMAIAVTGDC